jgi:maleate isomerase
VVEELNRLAARRVAVLSPYSQEVNETIQRSLEASGFDVVYTAGMDLPSAFGIADVLPEQVVDYAREHLQGVEADCLFVSCANLRSLEAIEGLRAVADMPVITSNQAVLESVRRVLALQHHDLAVVAGPEG